MKKRKASPWIPVLLIAMLLLALLCVNLWLEKGRAERSAAEIQSTYESLEAEYKAALESLTAENEENMRAAAEYKAAYESLSEQLEEYDTAARSAEEYREAYAQLLSDMFSDAALAEKLGNLTINVWHNAIWQRDSEETDRFTKEDGEFVSDFNDALRKLFNDKEFSGNISVLSKCQRQVTTDMKGMLDPPAGWENAFSALESVYYAYVTLTDVVIRCDGSLESYTNDFTEADKDFLQKYHSAELYA